MKKILTILLIAAVLIALPVSAAKTTDDTQGNASGASVKAEEKVTGANKAADKSNQSGGSSTAQANKNESAGQGSGISTNLATATQSQQEIKAQIKEILKENNSGLSSNNRLKNENTVRVAVKTLLAAENISGGIGPQISAIAKEFNNSVKIQYTAEETIQNRNALSRFFFGGDSQAAGEIQQQIEANRVRLENLNNLMNQCGDCDEELKAMIQEQIQLLEQEQNRLQELSQAELNDKGLLGGLFG